MDDKPTKLEGARIAAAFKEWSALDKAIPALELELAALKEKREKLAGQLRFTLLGSDPLLTRRENEVLAMVKQNRSNKEIGGVLNIAERTVKFHVSSLLLKFDKRTRYDL